MKIPARGRRCLPLTLLWMLCLGLAPVQAHDAGAIRSAIAKVRPGVVGIATVLPTRSPPIKLFGTGFAVADGRHILTNAHVLPDEAGFEEFETLGVLVGRGSRPDIRQTRVVARDPDHDLALLEIDGPPLEPLELGDSGEVREGDLMLFTGFPIGLVLGLYPATHQAMVAAITPIAEPAGSAGELDLARVRRLRDPYLVFQLDGTAYPGNSGSPVYDHQGAVRAILNKVFVQGSKENVLKNPSGISYAVPIRHARALLRQVTSR